MSKENLRCTPAPIESRLELLQLPDELLLDIVRWMGDDEGLHALYSSCRRLREAMLPSIGSAFIELREAADDGGQPGLEDGPTQLLVGRDPSPEACRVPVPETKG